jgi:hypothetical protein
MTIHNIKIDDYVFASRWSDQDWNDPWAVGFVQSIKDGYLQLGKKDGSLIDSVNCYRKWSHAVAVTGQQGAAIIDEYITREGTDFDPTVLARILVTEPIKQEKVVKIWEFDNAPIKYQQLSEDGGDKDWVALVIGYGDETPFVVEQISSGLFSVGRYTVEEGIVYISGRV